MAKNCWKNCTPLETGLGLALIVSVTFLLIMVIVYMSVDSSVGTYFGPKYYNCRKACACLTDFSKLLFFPMNPDTHSKLSDFRQEVFGVPFGAQQTQLRPTFCLGKNYSIAAIVKQRYVDNLEYFEFASPAAILSPKWLLSHTSLDYDTAGSIYAAIGSKYWSKSGYIHKVHKIFPIVESLILLKLEADIIINVNFIQLIGASNVQTVIITTWDPAYKHEKALETNLSVINDAHCGNGTFCAIADANIHAAGIQSTLAINGNVLVGFYKDTLCYQNKCLYKFKSIRRYIFNIMLYIQGNIL